MNVQESSSYFSFYFFENDQVGNFSAGGGATTGADGAGAGDDDDGGVGSSASDAVQVTFQSIARGRKGASDRFIRGQFAQINHNCCEDGGDRVNCANYTLPELPDIYSRKG